MSSRILKVTLKEGLSARLASTAQADGVAEAEIVRRALLEYFGPRESQDRREGQDRASFGPGSGQDRATKRPESGPIDTPPLLLPPSSPPDHPNTPPLYLPPLFGDALIGGAGDPDTPPPGTVLEFRCIRGKRSEGTRWFLTADQVRRWEEVYPDMDVLAEAKRAREYAEANGLKTSGGMKAYLVKWLNRSQNNGRYPRRVASSLARSGRPTLQDTYGYATWEEWEAALHKHLTGGDLEQEMVRLREIRSRWEGGASAAPGA